jgi:ABC-2 type transport system ATP-binding protein
LSKPSPSHEIVFGIDTTLDPVSIHRRIGYLPGEFALHDRLTGAQLSTTSASCEEGWTGHARPP